MTVTHAPTLSDAFAQPFTSDTVGEPVVAGVWSVIGAPVCVRVGKNAICAWVNDGPIETGGQASCEAIWVGSIVGVGTAPVADAGKVPSNWNQPISMLSLQS